MLGPELHVIALNEGLDPIPWQLTPATQRRLERGDGKVTEEIKKKYRLALKAKLLSEIVL